MQTLPLTEAKDKLSALVDSVDATHEAVTITKHGRPAAVLLAASELESLLETIAWLSRRETMGEVLEAESEIEAGLTTSLSDFKAQLALDSVEEAPSAEQSGGLRVSEPRLRADNGSIFGIETVRPDDRDAGAFPEDRDDDVQ